MQEITNHEKKQKNKLILINIFLPRKLEFKSRLLTPLHFACRKQFTSCEKHNSTIHAVEQNGLKKKWFAAFTSVSSEQISGFF